MNIDELIKRKNDVEKKRERLLGKLEEARSTLQRIDNELIELGINPNDLEDEILRLKKQQSEELNALNQSIINAEQIINTIEKRINSL
tara:strand:+ start:181 stop:444 length:264 start_codon:yes stop_codon:yes gene_type:complete